MNVRTVIDENGEEEEKIGGSCNRIEVEGEG